MGYIPKIAIDMQPGLATRHIIARDKVPKQTPNSIKTDEANSKKGLLRFARNDKVTLFNLHPKSQLLKLIFVLIT